MLQTREAAAVLDREFLEVRGKILEVAAALDRLDRAPSHHNHGEAPDRRLAQIRRSLEALLEPDAGRAETVQHIFSLEYQADWRERFGMTGPRLQ
jgi:hypothetical protein